jgi:hypothetical protein
MPNIGIGCVFAPKTSCFRDFLCKLRANLLVYYHALQGFFAGRFPFRHK